jgi:8-oxo-dGTP pyrophosphatase MutT (NUDIX family)
VTLPVAVRRQGYRLAFALLRAYWFVRRPTLHGVKCVITDGDTILLVRHTYGPRRWDLPGGAVKRAEPPVDAARREMREELGLEISEWTSLGEVSATVHHCRDSLACFGAELSAPALALNRAELAAGRWFRRSELPSEISGIVGPILARLDATGGRQVR